MDGSPKRKMNVTFYDNRKGHREISLVLKHPKKVNQDFQLNFYGLDRTTDVTETSLVHFFQFWITTGFLPYLFLYMAVTISLKRSIWWAKAAGAPKCLQVDDVIYKLVFRDNLYIH